MGIRRRIGRWALIAVAVPVTARAADRLGQRLESNRGPNRYSKALRTGATQLRRVNGRSGGRSPR
jgi:hypothetical protein